MARAWHFIGIGKTGKSASTLTRGTPGMRDLDFPTLAENTSF